MDQLLQQAAFWIGIPTLVYVAAFLIRNKTRKASWINKVKAIALWAHTLIAGVIFIGLCSAGFIRFMPDAAFTMQYQSVFFLFVPLLFCWSFEKLGGSNQD